MSTNIIGDKSIEYKNNIIKKYTDIKIIILKSQKQFVSLNKGDRILLL